MVEKIKEWQKPPTQIDNTSAKRGYQSQISVIMTVLAVGVMVYIGIRNISETWGVYALIQAGLGFFGYITMQSFTGQGVFPKSYPNFESETIIIIGSRAITMKYLSSFLMAVVFGLAITVVGQLIVAYSLSISTTDQALYFLFASVCEELFFRGFIIEIMTILDNTITQIMAVMGSAFLFVLAHVNYYGNTIALASVIVLGTVLAVDYVIFRNITAVIIIHFVINAIGTVQWLVTL